MLQKGIKKPREANCLSRFPVEGSYLPSHVTVKAGLLKKVGKKASP
jgi:hypothetical protein